MKTLFVVPHQRFLWPCFRLYLKAYLDKGNITHFNAPIRIKEMLFSFFWVSSEIISWNCFVLLLSLACWKLHMFSPVSVCAFVGLWARLHKKYQTESHKTLMGDWSWTKNRPHSLLVQLPIKGLIQKHFFSLSWNKLWGINLNQKKTIFIDWFARKAFLKKKKFFGILMKKKSDIFRWQVCKCYSSCCYY